MTFRILLLGIVSGLVGCAPAWIHDPMPDKSVADEARSAPALGEIATVDVGEDMFVEYKKVATTTRTATLTGDAKGDMELGHAVEWPAGTAGLLARHPMSNSLVLCRDFSSKPGVGGPAHTCLVDQNADGIFDASMFRNRDKTFPLSRPAPYKTEAKTDYSFSQGSFQRSVLYQGVTGRTLKISFREFIDSMARPAFTQDITYDLASDGSGEIAFKGLRVKVIKATNSTIRYVVERPFKDSSLGSQ